MIKVSLQFLGKIVNLIYIFRRFLYDSKFLSSYNLDRPVISVGNIEMGGTGKTPLTVWLAQELEKLELKGTILTRVYKRKTAKDSVLIHSENKHRLGVEITGD